MTHLDNKQSLASYLSDGPRATARTNRSRQTEAARDRTLQALQVLSLLLELASVSLLNSKQSV